jgi:glutamine amidotransferase PdxT
MEGISESIGLAATCDVICSLWQEEEEKELGIINLGMQKNRFGRNHGHCTFKIKYETLTLSETNPDYFSTDSPDSVVNSAESALHALVG